ncbi:MAG: UTRA domain-containing protein [Proteobacteria bacterium]|nr:UTRA domain-containing protein [Pseudomonadota bacterium]
MPNVSRAYAKVMRSAVLWGLAATAAFYIVIAGGVAGQLLGEGAQAFLARYCAGHLIEYVEVAMFFIGMAALLIKRRDIVEQFAGLKESILGPVPPGGQSADDCDSLVAKLDAAPAHQQQSYLIRRLRSVDGRAVLLEHLHIDAQRCPGLLELPLDRSLTELMAEHYGILEHRPTINMRPTALSVSQAEALGVAAGTPSLYLSRTILDQFDEVVELDQEFWRHDAIDICVSATGRPKPEATE